jgi:DNA-binding transcriptional LysR family regulator
MELSQLETFLTVAREGSFSNAARALHRTQPAVSQVIARLEETLGQALFDRSSRRVVLTDAGNALLEHAERLLNLRRAALADLEDVRALRAGRLAVAANELTCLYLLPVLDEFRRLYPAVRVTVQRSLASQIPSSVLDYAVDLGVVTYRPEDPGVRSIFVYKDDIAFVVPPGHPLAREKEVRIQRLAQESFVAHHLDSPYRQRVLDTFRRHKVSLQMPVEMPTLDAIKRFVAMGNGVALLPAITIEQELAHGVLVRVGVREITHERPMRLVLRKSGQVSNATQAFLAVAETYATTQGGRYEFRAER